METTTKDPKEFQDKIIQALTWHGDSKERHDIMYRAFIDMMEYRREIAKRYMEADGDEAREYLSKSFEQCNENIKKILGL